jgi:hypothetical protein
MMTRMVAEIVKLRSLMTISLKERIALTLVEFTIDSYTFVDSKENECNPKQMFIPRPPAWPARIEPNLFCFKVDEIFRDVLLTIDAPDAITKSEDFNISTVASPMHPNSLTYDFVTDPNNRTLYVSSNDRGLLRITGL